MSGMDIETDLLGWGCSVFSTNIKPYYLITEKNSRIDKKRGTTIFAKKEGDVP
jgi:hypothetical protein